MIYSVCSPATGNIDLSVCPAQQTLLQFPSPPPNSAEPTSSQLAYLRALREGNRVDMQVPTLTAQQRQALQERGLNGPLPVVAHIRNDAYRALRARLVDEYSLGFWQRVQCSLDDTSAKLLREGRLTSSWFLLRSVVTDRSVPRDKPDRVAPPYDPQLPSQPQWFVLSNVLPNFDGALISYG